MTRLVRRIDTQLTVRTTRVFESQRWGQRLQAVRHAYDGTKGSRVLVVGEVVNSSFMNYFVFE